MSHPDVQRRLSGRPESLTGKVFWVVDYNDSPLVFTTLTIAPFGVQNGEVGILQTQSSLDPERTVRIISQTSSPCLAEHKTPLPYHLPCLPTFRRQN